MNMKDNRPLMENKENKYLFGWQEKSSAVIGIGHQKAFAGNQKERKNFGPSVRAGVFRERILQKRRECGWCRYFKRVNFTDSQISCPE